MYLADNQLISNTKWFLHTRSGDGEGLKDVGPDDQGGDYGKDNGIEPLAGGRFLGASSRSGVLVFVVFGDDGEENERQNGGHAFFPNLEPSEAFAQLDEHQQQHEDVDVREDDEEPPPEFLLLSDDFQQDVDVVIGDEAVIGFLSSGFKLFPAERDWDGEQRWND